MTRPTGSQNRPEDRPAQRERGRETGRQSGGSSSCRSIHFNANNSYKFMCSSRHAWTRTWTWTRRQIDRLKSTLPPTPSLSPPILLYKQAPSRVSHSIRTASPITVVQSAKKFINLSATHLLPTVRRPPPHLPSLTVAHLVRHSL